MSCGRGAIRLIVVFLAGSIFGLGVRNHRAVADDKPPRAKVDAAAADGDADKPAPSKADVHAAQAIALAKKQDYRKAIAEFTAAIRLEPKRAALFVGRGKMYTATGDLRRAMSDLDLALRLDPKSVEGYGERAAVWRAKGDFSRCKADYESALELDPKHVVASCNLAWLLATCPVAELRDGRRGVRLATEACEQTKRQEPELMDTLAAAYAEAGDFKAAQTWEDRALKRAAELNQKMEGAEERLDLYKAGKPYREPMPKKK